MFGRTGAPQKVGTTDCCEDQQHNCYSWAL